MRAIRTYSASVVGVVIIAWAATFTFAQGPAEGNGFWGLLYRFIGSSSSQQVEQSTQSESLEQSRSAGIVTGPSRVLRHWNQIAIDASGLDHTPLQPGETRTFGEQLGPGRAGRAVAIVHIAIHDAVNAIAGRYRTYTGIRRASRFASVDAAIARAARDTLVAMFPSQRSTFDRELASDLSRIPNLLSKAAGINAGRRAAAAIVALRENDGSDYEEPRMGEGYTPDDDPGIWRQDPISQIPVALGAKWGEVKPFVMTSGSQFRVPEPPAMTSAEYATAYDEVIRLGGDGTTTPTERTAHQTFVGTFWAYDGTPSLCAPPRLYNQLALAIARERGTHRDVVELARVLALVNVAMADAGIAIWESKFHYNVWRPVTGVREADEGTGPTGAGDGNPDTRADATFSPLGAPASNLVGPNFTPPFPSYPSGHAGIGAALFQILRRVYRTDRIAFTFVSEEFNGETRDNGGNVRPFRPRRFQTLSQAEEENGQSRIYLGIHWSFDKTEGITQGRRIANYVFERAFRPAAFSQ